VIARASVYANLDLDLLEALSGDRFVRPLHSVVEAE
jgi:hypothetical protein